MSDRPRPSWPQALALALLAVAAAALVACAINPATGESQLAFFNEAEEIQLGAEVDREFLSNSYTYADPELEAYVESLGRRLAAVSERPDLPWSFRIADDAMVNAFALPGGRIYVTRGLLAHLGREAELAGVLGHEIGHVTARHSVNALSRQLALTVGLIAGLELLETDETAEMVGSLGLGLLFLKFGRNQERQADQLGVRYVRRAGIDPHGVVDALRVLQRVSQAQDGGWFPVWLSTHPDPDNRWQRLAEEAGLGPGRPAGELVPESDVYLARLDGMVYGPDPRHGALRGSSYVQLRDGFEMTFPKGWKVQREGQTLAAENAAGNALVMLLPQLGESPRDAADAFAGEGIEVRDSWDETLRGLPARLVRFRAELEEEPWRGMAAFVRAQGRVVAVLGLSSVETWDRHGLTVRSSVRSIGRVAQPRRQPSTPDRLRIVTLDRAMNARQIARRYAPRVEPETLALLNQVEVEEPIPAGRRVKVVQR